MKITQSDSSPIEALVGLMEKTTVTPIRLSVDKGLIQKDIERLNGEKAKSNNEFNIKSIDSLIKYLEKLLRVTGTTTGGTVSGGVLSGGKGTERRKFAGASVKGKNDEKGDKVNRGKSDNTSILELSWDKGKDGIYKTYPINFINVPLYKINTCNYIEVRSNQRLIMLDLTEMAEIIAFEFMYNDLGYDSLDIEKELSDCALYYPEDSSYMIDIFREDANPLGRMYQLSRDIKVEDSIHLDKEDRVLWDYFGTKQYKYRHNSTKYGDVVNYSCNQAALRVLSKINVKVPKEIELNALMLTHNMVAFTLERSLESGSNDTISVEDIEKNILEGIEIRSFGRHFKINTDTKIF